MKIKVPYLTSRANADGSRRWYWQPTAELRRHGFALQRLPDDEAQAIAEAGRWNAKVAAWRAGEDGRSGPQPGTLRDIIRRYRQSDAFTELRPKTRQGYDWCLGIIDDWAGDRPAAAIGTPDVKAFYAPIRKRTPSKANAVLTMLRTVYKWAQSEELVEDNPADRDRIKRRGVKPKPRPMWSRATVEAFVAAADAAGRHSVGTAVLLNSWCGQRMTDVLAFARPRIAGGELRLTQSKTGEPIVLPIDVIPRLAARLQAEEQRQQGRKVASLALIVSEETGEPYTLRNFSEWVERLRHAAADTAAAAGDEQLAAELRGLVFQRLRAHAVVELYLAGCDFGLVSQITGHTAKAIQTIIDHYLPLRRDLATLAFRKRLEKEGKNGA